jgi:hypothetical protein
MERRLALDAGSGSDSGSGSGSPAGRGWDEGTPAGTPRKGPPVPAHSAGAADDEVDAAGGGAAAPAVDAADRAARDPGGGDDGDGGRAGQAPGGYVADEGALRGTRFEFGGRRPYSFSAARPTYRPSSRPLPGIGTVALGRVVRVAPYGAFVDFLGFRGLIHISQLMPGYRIERVEDVVQVGDEVVVRVIAVDPERRHINLALVPGAAGTARAGGAPAIAATRPAALVPAAAGPYAPPVAPGPAGAAAPRPPAPPIAPPPPAPRPDAAAAAPPAAPASPTPSPLPAAPAPAPPAPPVPAVASVPPEAALAAQPAQAARAISRVPPPAAAGPAAAQPEAHPEARAGARAAPPDRAARPSPPRARISRHASRAVRRELADPAHPMARLLAAAGDAALRSPGDKNRARPPTQPEAHLAAPGTIRRAGEAPAPETPAGPEPGRAGDPLEVRPVHVAEPASQPEDAQPATLEALAARFGHRRDRAPGPARPEHAGAAGAPPGGASAASRSRQEREKQAAILARLREEAARSRQ